jgi:hypothetical protein
MYMNSLGLMTRSETAQALGLTHQSVSDLNHDGFGPACYGAAKGGKGIQARYRRADVEAYAQARRVGLTHRDATLVTIKAAHGLTLDTIKSRFGASDPELAAAQVRAAEAQLSLRLLKLRCTDLDGACRRIECQSLGLPAPEVTS